MVAERAGTSVATVSLVANGKDAGHVSAQNAERVRQAIAELGYVADHAARALASGSSNLVVFVTPDASNPYFGAVIRGLRTGLGDAYQLLVSVTGEGDVPTAAALGRLAALRPAGVVVDAPSEAFLEELRLDTALVLLDAPRLPTTTAEAASGGVAADRRAVSVDFDLLGGVRALLDHLHVLGHRQLGYLGGRTATDTFLLRRLLLEREAAVRGMRVHADDRAESIIDLEAAAAAFVDSWPRWRDVGVTALVCATDTHAYGVLQSARAMGMPVPGELAVVGFDDLASSVVSDPPLTSVRLPGEALGRAGAEQLLARIEGRTVAPAPVIGADLVIRASTIDR
ncbi:LacI family DNA-binding transcriptional regulator [Plantibacter sp. CFBP 8775]|nr:LacI family DNA-binding transcriptional regulator [Plantibacter sp. CFBP 8775]MBD8103990.1 LacI family DNA-binding transcriptional regulator [Plantibacter sp. CFBP 8775]